MERSNTEWIEQRLRKLAARIKESDSRYLELSQFLEPAAWAEKNISFEYDISANFEKFDLSLTPYLKDPLNTWNFSNTIREVTVVSPEQMGKSLSWIIGLLYNFIYNPCLSIIVYPSDEKGVAVNKEKIEPLIKAIPRLAVELEQPRSQKKNCYHFSNLKCYFMGAGSRVTSQSSKIRIADEVDDWIAHEEKVANLQDLRKRARSFSESMLFKVCSPTIKTGPIWKEFKAGSQGYWHLRCSGCGQLTMRSCDVFNLQWELDEDKNIIDESLTLICPICKHEHKESNKKEMNLNGSYIHNNKGLIKTTPSFQWGALASQLGGLLSWGEIAKAQMNAGKSGNYQEQALFDNSYRGLPFKARKVDDASLETLKKHIWQDDLPRDKFEGIFYAGDTQDDKIYYIIGAIDSDANMYILEANTEVTLDGIRKKIESDYSGFKILAAIQDEGGHRTLEIQKFATTISNLYTYKGNNRQAKRIERSKERRHSKLLLTKEAVFRVEALYYIHSLLKQDNNYLYFTKDLPEEFYEHLLAYRQDNTKKNGDSFENWTHDGRKHDYFDCIKMLYTITEYFKINYRGLWLKNNASWLRKKETRIIQSNSRQGFVTGWKDRF